MHPTCYCKLLQHQSSFLFFCICFYVLNCFPWSIEDTNLHECFNFCYGFQERVLFFVACGWRMRQDAAACFRPFRQQPAAQGVSLNPHVRDYVYFSGFLLAIHRRIRECCVLEGASARRSLKRSGILGRSFPKNTRKTHILRNLGRFRQMLTGRG